MLKFNTFRAARYLRSKFVEGKFLLASEGTDLELEMLDRMRDTIKRDIGDVVVNDAFKISRLGANQVLVSPGEAWFGGLPYQLRSAKDELVSGSNLAPGLLPLGVNITDDSTGRGKLINFNSGNTTPTGLYRVVITASEQVITTVQDPFLQNVNITEDTSQKIRLLYKINVVLDSAQTQTPIPYTNESTGQNLTNQIVVTPTSGGNGELLLVTSVSGSTEIDGRKFELTVRNDPGLGGGNPIPNGSNDQASFANGTLIDSYGTAYHINAIFNDVVSTQVIIRIDSEIGSPQPQLINTVPYTLVKRDVFVQDDTNGTPLGNLFFPIAKIDFDSTDGIRHPSKISDLRPRKVPDALFQSLTNQKFDVKLTEGGVKSFNLASQLASWSAQFVLVNPSGPAQTIAANSMVILDGGSLAYEMNLSGGGAIDLGQLSINVLTAVGAVLTLSPVSLANVRIGNTIAVGNQVAQITAIDDVNHTLTVSPNITNTGSGTVYLDSFAPGTAPVDENTFILTVRHGSNVWSGGFPSFSSDEQEDRSAYFRSDNPVTWTGTQLSFTSDIVLEIVNTVSGTITRHTVLAANSPFTLNNGESIYISINRASSSETVTPINSGITPIPAQSQSTKDIFVLFRRVDAGASQELHIPFHKQVIDPGQTVRLGASGSGSGSSTSSGIGDNLDSLTWKASFTDNFPSIPSGSGAVNISAGFTNPANYSITNKLWALNYDASKTVTGTGTAMTLSANPSFTIAAGDMLIVNGFARRITVVTTQSSITIESAFPTNPSASPCTVSQAVYTVDINNYADAGISIASVLTDALSSMMIEYDDSTSLVLQEGVPPNVGFTASSDGTNYSPVGLRTVNLTDVDNTFALPNSGSDLFLRFFANKSSGSGVVNFFRYRAFFHSQTNLDNGGFVQAQAYTRLDGLGAQINCLAPTVVNSKSRISLTSSFGFYTPGINAGMANGQLLITVNGQKLPRFIDSVTTPNGYYKEISSNIIELDSDYSSLDFDIEILKLFPTSSSGGGGSSGTGKNYLSPIITSNSSGNPNPGNGDFESGNGSGWSLAHSALSSFAPTSVASPGTAFSASAGGTPAAGSLSLSVVTAGSQIGGSFSGDLASSAASTAGDLLISDAFFIDSEDKAKVLTFKFYYEAISGAFNFSGSNANSFAIWLYDVTNGAWIQPAGVYGMTQGFGVGYVTGTFQTSSNSTKYQLAIININATASSYSIYLDDFVVGPQTAPFGPIVTDWVQYTPTFVGFGTPTSVLFYSRRVGDNLEVKGSFGSGTSTATPASISVGFNGADSNVVIDTNKIAGDTVVGNGFGGAAVLNVITVLAPNVNASTIQLGNGVDGAARNPVQAQDGSTIASGGESVQLFWSVPIVGWSSNVQMSNDTDTRVVAAAAHPSSSGSVTANTQINFDVVDVDTHGAITTGGSWAFKVPVSGNYWVEAGSQSTTVPSTLQVFKNGTLYAFLATVTTAGIEAGGIIVPCKAGDVLDIRPDTTYSLVTGSGQNTHVSINRLSGPAVVAATEKVVAVYFQDGSGSVSTGTAAVIVYANKDIDTHNAVSGGRFTAPVSGTYQCSFSGNGGSSVTIFIYKNGVQARLLTPNAAGSGGAGSLPITVLAGDILDFRPDGSVTINAGTTSWSLIK